MEALAESLIDSTCWKVPGFAVSFIADKKVAWEKSFGKRDVAKNLDAELDTVWNIGSITKTFTGALTSAAIDDKLVTLDTKLNSILTDFELQDSTASESTFRDLLTHRTGLPRHDMAWTYGASPSDIKDLAKKIRYLSPSKPFRYQADYCNWGYVLAGEALAVKAGKKNYGEYLQEKILTPLKMANTYHDTDTAIKAEKDKFAINYDLDLKGDAKPFKQGNNKVEELTCPAGCLASTVKDMAKFVAMMMPGAWNGSAATGGPQILSYPSLMSIAKAWEAYPNDMIGNCFVKKANCDAEMYTPDYGLGLFVGSYRGYRLVWHNGNVYGASASIMMLPDLGIGGVILTNMAGGNFGMMNFLLAGFDQFLGEQPWWNKAASCKLAKLLVTTPKPAYLSPTPKPTWTYSPTEYANTYSNPMYGTVTVSVDANTKNLKLAWNTGVTGELEPMDAPKAYNMPKKDTFNGKVTIPWMKHYAMPMPAYFPRGDDGKVMALGLPLEPGILPELVMFTHPRFVAEKPSACRSDCFLRSMVKRMQGLNQCEYMTHLYTCMQSKLCPIPTSLCQPMAECKVYPPSCGV
eukprot:TRINITY_DN53576_c0_g1_i1.p1 TRINITY_DN53576_c0_g1~~TRINITY_DN53576_c0_g1_i1.p1  ORF type:complete len:651 (-),score=47.09 TRINITY_DN53576_c0_g1_i1:226-1953(-)